MELASQSLGLQLDVLEVRVPDEIESAFESAKRKRAEALLIPVSSLLVDFEDEVGRPRRAAQVAGDML